MLIADGSEEIESLTPVDVFRRAGADCDLVSVCGEFITGSRKIEIKADKLIGEVNFADYDAVIVPGGMPGARIISENVLAAAEVKAAMNSGKLVAAICAAPAVFLAKHGLVSGRKITCYPAEGFIGAIKAAGGEYTGKDVEEDKNVITASGPKAAMAFSLAICEYLGLAPAF